MVQRDHYHLPINRLLLNPSNGTTCLAAQGFPGAARGKEPACQCSICKRCGLDPWVGKIPWRRAWQPTPVGCLENPMDRGAWQAIAPGVTKSWTQLNQLSTHAPSLPGQNQAPSLTFHFSHPENLIPSLPNPIHPALGVPLKPLSFSALLPPYRCFPPPPLPLMPPPAPA